MKKAFTLIELLGVIILLAIIALVVYPIVDKVIQNSRDEAYLRSIENLKNAARTYGTINNLGYSDEVKKLSLRELKKAGLIKDENITNPKTNKELEGCILYSWDNTKNQYQYEYDEACSVETDQSCFAYEEREMLQSYDVNKASCGNFISEWFDFNIEDSNRICNGEFVGDDSLYLLMLDNSYLYSQLVENNIIYNVSMANVLAITEYLCGDVEEDGTIIKGSEMDPVIPSKINGQEVKIIGYSSFRGKGLSSVKIPNTVMIIEEAAFEENKLSSIDLSNLNNLNAIFPLVFSCNKILRNNFVGIKEYTYDYFEFGCVN